MTNLRSTIPASDTRSLRTIAKEEGVNYSTFVSRLSRGYPYLAAIGKMKAKKVTRKKSEKNLSGSRKTYAWKGENLSARAICLRERVRYPTVMAKLKGGMTIEQAIKDSIITRIEVPPGFSIRSIVKDSGFTRPVVEKHLTEYALTPEEIIYLGTCPISKYLPKGVTISSLAKNSGLSKKHIEREIRTGRLVVNA